MIPVCEPLLDGNEKKYVDDCLNSGWISSAGKYVTEFEEKFAKYCGCKYGVTTTSGTTALHLALAAWGLGRVMRLSCRHSQLRHVPLLCCIRELHPCLWTVIR